MKKKISICSLISIREVWFSGLLSFVFQLKLWQNQKKVRGYFYALLYVQFVHIHSLEDRALQGITEALA